jgi:hypothetical protein
LRILEHLPFLVHQPGVNLERLLPHLLNGLGQGAVTLQCVKKNFDRGKPFASRIARFRQQSPGHGVVASDMSPRRIASGIGRGKVVGRELSAARYIFDQALPIDRQRQSLPHLRIIQRRLGHIDEIKIRGQVRINSEPLRMVLSIMIGFRQGQRIDRVSLAGAKGALSCIHAHERIKIDFLQTNPVRIPIRRAFFHVDDVIDLPLG